MSEEPKWFVILNDYFNKAIFRRRDSDVWAAENIRKIAKWWLDLMRNLIVVSLLQYLGRKSDKLIVKIVAEVSFFLLLGYTISYFQTYLINPFPYMKNQRWQLVFYMTFCVVVFGGLLWMVSIGIGVAVEEIARSQNR